MVQSENIFDVNAVVKKINDADMELDKLEGVVKYTGDDSAKVIAKLAEHINNFTSRKTNKLFKPRLLR